MRVLLEFPDSFVENGTMMRMVALLQVWLDAFLAVPLRIPGLGESLLFQLNTWNPSNCSLLPFSAWFAEISQRIMSYMHIHVAYVPIHVTYMWIYDIMYPKYYADQAEIGNNK